MKTTGLTLTRRVDEAILIGDDIEITVIGIQGKQARIHVSAPREVTVLRKELKERDKAGEVDAAWRKHGGAA